MSICSHEEWSQRAEPLSLTEMWAVSDVCNEKGCWECEHIDKDDRAPSLRTMCFRLCQLCRICILVGQSLAVKKSSNTQPYLRDSALRTLIRPDPIFNPHTTLFCNRRSFSLNLGKSSTPTARSLKNRAAYTFHTKVSICTVNINIYDVPAHRYQPTQPLLPLLIISPRARPGTSACRSGQWLDIDPAASSPVIVQKERKKATQTKETGKIIT